MIVYAYTTGAHPGLIKIGQTDRDVETRIIEQLGTANIPYTLLYQGEVAKPDGTTATDGDVHRVLKRMHIQRETLHHSGNPSEWFRCDLDTVLTAIASIETGRELDAGRHRTHKMRDEQQGAVDLTVDYFKSHEDTPRFLWNAKMRFGKTFTAYQLAKRMGFTRILVLTYKPAVAGAWRDDLLGHVDFQGWRFHERSEPDLPDISDETPMVWFASFQDVLGKTRDGNVKEHNRHLIQVDWDLVVFDEYHFGAWRDGAQELFTQFTGDTGEEKADTGEPDVEEVENRINGDHFLYLSGTPFRAISDGEFAEDQIFNWTYPDEQREKRNWPGPGPNRYAELPAMQLRTYLLSDLALAEAEEGEANVFTLSGLFRASRREDGEYRFEREDYVQGFIDTIAGRNNRLLTEAMRERDRHLAAVPDEAEPQFPYADSSLRAHLRHTVWYLPNVAACFAMEALLGSDPFFGSNYKVVNIGGSAARTGERAKEPVDAAIRTHDATITLSCGKLMTGVTVPEWTGIFMLRNLESPETYFQAAFRVQSPWTVDDATQPSGRRILKHDCYVFDFDPQRSLRLVAQLATHIASARQQTPERQVADFTEFLPIFCYNGGTMQAVDAAEILQIAESGLSSSMMVKKWKSARLVTLDGPAFEALLQDEELIEALKDLEQFRNNNVDIEGTARLVISSNEALKKAKQAKHKPTQEDDEEAKKARKAKQELREALVGFLQRIPAFMYVTDAREAALLDVIREQEGRRFERTTGLSLAMFERLEKTGILNSRVIDAAIISFRQYENGSLAYAGNEKDRSGLLGGMYKTLSPEEQEELLAENRSTADLLITPLVTPRRRA
jgi:hypothetical protein